MEYIRACHSYGSFGNGKDSTKFLIRQIFLKNHPTFINRVVNKKLKTTQIKTNLYVLQSKQ